MAKAKSTAKKAATKRKSAPAKKRTVRGAIPRAEPHNYFVLTTGTALKDYKELADALEEMEDHIYGHHVNHERNDFAHWIADTLNDIELAEKIRGANGKHHMQIVIYRHILER